LFFKKIKERIKMRGYKKNDEIADFISDRSMKIDFAKSGKVVLFLISLLLIPSLALATFEVKCPDPLFTSNMTAGTTYNFSCDLKNDEGVAKPVFAEFNITEKSGAFPVWLNDFSIGAEINSDPLNCTEKTNGNFYCYNGTEGNSYDIDSGTSTLNLSITSKPNLYPADYVFSLSVFTTPSSTGTSLGTVATAAGGFGYLRKTTTTTTTIPTITTPTTTTTVPTPTTTTTIAPATNPITGFAVFVSSPLGMSLLLSIIIAVVLIIVFYKKWYVPRKIKKE